MDCNFPQLPGYLEGQFQDFINDISMVEPKEAEFAKNLLLFCYNDNALPQSKIQFLNLVRNPTIVKAANIFYDTIIFKKIVGGDSHCCSQKIQQLAEKYRLYKLEEINEFTCIEEMKTLEGCICTSNSTAIFYMQSLLLGQVGQLEKQAKDKEETLPKAQKKRFYVECTAKILTFNSNKIDQFKISEENAQKIARIVYNDLVKNPAVDSFQIRHNIITGIPVIASFSNRTTIIQTNQKLGSGSFKKVFNGYKFTVNHNHNSSNYRANITEIAVLRVGNTNNDNSIIKKAKKEDKIASKFSSKFVIRKSEINFDCGPEWVMVKKKGVFCLGVIIQSPYPHYIFKEMIHCLKEILEGLSEIHKKGHMHRDIKPGNMILEMKKNGHFRGKLIDLGFTIPVEKVHGLYGSEVYYPPEIERGVRWKANSQTQKGDLWAFGATLFKLFHPKRKFHLNVQKKGEVLPKLNWINANPQAFIDSLFLDWPAQNEVEIYLQKLILKLLSPDPFYRSTVIEAIEQLAAIESLASRYDKEEEKSLPNTLYNLYFLYANGRGEDRNDEEDFTWYKMLAEQGLPEAQYELGLFYAKGKGVDQNHKEAFIWIKKAAEQGLPEAQNKLGLFYEIGIGVDQNHKEAFNWIKKAAEQGLPDSQLKLGLYYARGSGCIAHDFEEAIKWTKLRAEKGDKTAIFNLAIFYASGKNKLKDWKKASEQILLIKNSSLKFDHDLIQSLYKTYEINIDEMPLDFKTALDSLLK